MTTPVDHWMLDAIDNQPTPDGAMALTRQSECVEFFDEKEGQWYEIVVRPIDMPCESSAAELDTERAHRKLR